MSDAPAVQCDRCGKRALLELRVGLPEVVPGHWSTVRLTVARPFLETGNLDLCEVCTPIVYNTICDKPKMLVNEKDPR